MSSAPKHTKKSHGRFRPPAVPLQWSVLPDQSEQSGVLAEALNIPLPIAKLLVQRGIDTPRAAKKFLNPSWQDLHDPFKMKDMTKAVDRLTKALQNQERILLYGDYDADGTTAIALMHSFMERYFKHLDLYTPSRFRDGYGFSTYGVDFAIEQKATLIITLDCGITSAEAVAYAAKNGIDVIICDHHLPSQALPQAFAILDPHQPDCNYPYKELSGAGVGFKLLQAFTLEHNLPENDLKKLLDLLSISIACDVVPMTGENRILAYYGLQELENSTRPGIVGLLKIAKQGFPVKIRDLVFGVGPIINAAGRMGDALLSVKFLIAQTEQEVTDFGKALWNKNRARRQADQRTEKAASAWFEALPDRHLRRSIVAFEPDWHQGVVGIVASRLAEYYRRPAVILTLTEDGFLTGSARSVPGYDLFKGLGCCAEHIDNFGGHQHAAGLKLRPEELPSFRKKFEYWAKQQSLQAERKPTLEISGEINLEAINDAFFEVLNQLSPYGPQHRTPVFMARQVYDAGDSRLVKGEHLFISVNQGKAIFPAVGFGMHAHWDAWKKGQPFDICFKIEQHTYRDRRYIRLMLKDMRPSE